MEISQNLPEVRASFIDTTSYFGVTTNSSSSSSFFDGAFFIANSGFLEHIAMDTRQRAAYIINCVLNIP